MRYYSGVAGISRRLLQALRGGSGMAIKEYDYPVLRLRAGREYSVLAGHPWLFSGAFVALPQEIPPGSVVDVLSSRGEWVARGHLNAHNSLALRVLTQDPLEGVDTEFYRRRIQ